ncbi:MAG TPA: CoA-binding protein, partial [Polyangia bacterium]
MPSVAIVGASSARHKYGNRAVRAYLRQGWTVFPVNPNEPSVEGIATFARVSDIPAHVDRVAL